MEPVQAQFAGDVHKCSSTSKSKFPFIIFIYLLFVVILLSFSPALAGPNSAEKRMVIRTLLLKTSPAFSEEQIRYVAQQSYEVYLVGNPDLPPRAFQIVFEEFKLNNRKLLEQIIPIYDKYFTLKELQSISNFYDTEVGRKMTRVMPRIQQEAAGLKNRGLSAEQMATLYNKYFTQEELRSISDFYNTQVGRKMTRVMPQITKEEMQVRQSWIQKTGIEVQKRIQERFKKEGIKVLP